MPLDRYATGLARQILGAACGTDTEARQIVAEAAAAGSEPMLQFARLTGENEAAIYARGARSVGLAFAEDIPGAVVLKPHDVDPARLGEMHSIRGTLIDQDVLFAAPGFAQLAALGRRVRREPDLARQICLVPPRRLRTHLARAHRETLMERALGRLATRWPRASAHKELTWRVRTGFALMLLAAVGLAALLPGFVLYLAAPVLALVYLAPAGLRLVAAVMGFMHPHREQLAPLSDAELPVYTVLVPLRDEAELVPQLINAMLALDYPRDRLDIKFVVEETSTDTLAALRPLMAVGPFELIEVPDGEPRTKPKAMNFALPLARGELLVVYDAEDVPEPDQLRLAAAKFESRPELDCLQAELVIDNAAESVLTALFTAEYAAQFGLVLPALARLGLPMPL
ncbi:MAG TPA: glycosyltransferase, partial [Devosiaceae bacterium]|nr:glycosyltransferase [Devosiaceae bacterium]